MAMKAVAEEEDLPKPPLGLKKFASPESVSTPNKKADVVLIGSANVRVDQIEGMSEQEISRLIAGLKGSLSVVPIIDYFEGPLDPKELKLAAGSTPKEEDDSFFLNQWLKNHTPWGYTSKIYTRPLSKRTDADWVKIDGKGPGPDGKYEAPQRLKCVRADQKVRHINGKRVGSVYEYVPDVMSSATEIAEVCLSSRKGTTTLVEVKKYSGYTPLRHPWNCSSVFLGTSMVVYDCINRKLKPVGYVPSAYFADPSAREKIVRQALRRSEKSEAARKGKGKTAELDRDYGYTAPLRSVAWLCEHPDGEGLLGPEPSVRTYKEFCSENSDHERMAGDAMRLLGDTDWGEAGTVEEMTRSDIWCHRPLYEFGNAREVGPEVDYIPLRRQEVGKFVLEALGSQYHRAKDSGSEIGLRPEDVYGPDELISDEIPWDYPDDKPKGVQAIPTVDFKVSSPEPEMRLLSYLPPAEKPKAADPAPEFFKERRTPDSPELAGAVAIVDAEGTTVCTNALNQRARQTIGEALEKRRQWSSTPVSDALSVSEPKHRVRMDPLDIELDLDSAEGYATLEHLIDAFIAHTDYLFSLRDEARTRRGEPSSEQILSDASLMKIVDHLPLAEPQHQIRNMIVADFCRPEEYRWLRFRKGASEAYRNRWEQGMCYKTVQKANFLKMIRTAESFNPGEAAQFRCDLIDFCRLRDWNNWIKDSVQYFKDQNAMLQQIDQINAESRSMIPVHTQYLRRLGRTARGRMMVQQERLAEIERQMGPVLKRNAAVIPFEVQWCKRMSSRSQTKKSRLKVKLAYTARPFMKRTKALLLKAKSFVLPGTQDLTDQAVGDGVVIPPTVGETPVYREHWYSGRAPTHIPCRNSRLERERREKRESLQARLEQRKTPEVIRSVTSDDGLELLNLRRLELLQSGEFLPDQLDKEFIKIHNIYRPRVGQRLEDHRLLRRTLADVATMR